MEHAFSLLSSYFIPATKRLPLVFVDIIWSANDARWAVGAHLSGTKTQPRRMGEIATFGCYLFWEVQKAFVGKNVESGVDYGKNIF